METNPAISTAEQIADFINKYGLGTSFFIFVSLIIYFNRVAIWSKISDIAGGSVRSMIYKEQIDQLKKDLAQERIDCDRKMSEMRRDYEAKLALLEKKFDDLNERILKQAQELSAMKERLANHLGSKSRGKAL